MILIMNRKQSQFFHKKHHEMQPFFALWVVIWKYINRREHFRVRSELI